VDWKKNILTVIKKCATLKTWREKFLRISKKGDENERRIGCRTSHPTFLGVLDFLPQTVKISK
jgi:hypothetical protein